MTENPYRSPRKVELDQQAQVASGKSTSVLSFATFVVLLGEIFLIVNIHPEFSSRRTARRGDELSSIVEVAIHPAVLVTLVGVLAAWFLLFLIISSPPLQKVCNLFCIGFGSGIASFIGFGIACERFS
jgi:hypothetical protein